MCLSSGLARVLHVHLLNIFLPFTKIAYFVPFFPHFYTHVLCVCGCTCILDANIVSNSYAYLFWIKNAYLSPYFISKKLQKTNELLLQYTYIYKHNNYDNNATPYISVYKCIID